MLASAGKSSTRSGGYGLSSKKQNIVRLVEIEGVRFFKSQVLAAVCIRIHSKTGSITFLPNMGRTAGRHQMFVVLFSTTGSVNWPGERWVREVGRAARSHWVLLDPGKSQGDRIYRNPDVLALGLDFFKY